MLDLQAYKVLQAVRQDHQVNLDQQDLKDNRVSLVLQDHRDRQDQQEIKDHLVLQDQLG